MKRTSCRPLSWVASAGLMAVACTQPLPPETIPPLPSAEPLKVTDSNAPDRTRLPAPAAGDPWIPPAAQVGEIVPGVPLWRLSGTKIPVVNLTFVFPRGSATDPVDKAGLTELMTDLLDDGAGKRTALELSDALQLLGADVSFNVDLDYVGVSVNALADQLVPTLELVADMLRRPTFPKEEFDRRKAQRLAQALANEARPQTARAAGVRSALYGSGYAGQLEGGTRSSLGRITWEDTKQQYRNLIAPEGMQVVVVGDLDDETLRAAVKPIFDGWKGKAKVEPRGVAGEAPKPGIYVIDYPKAAQSCLGVAIRTEGVTSPFHYAEKVYDRELGGAFVSRLNMNLRESKGYTYGARSLFRRWKSIGYFGMFADVQTDATAASVKEVFAELQGFCADRPITDAQREQAVGGLLLGLAGGFEESSQVAERLAFLQGTGLPPDHYAQQPARLLAVKTADAQAAAQRYCDGKQFVTVIAGDAEKILPGLQELGLPIFRLDAEGRAVTP